MTDSRALAAIVLAAGEGKRFKSSRPKMLHELCGLPLVAYPLAALGLLKPARAIVVVGRGADQVEHAARGLTKLKLEFALQPKQLGTADAARAGDEALGTFKGDVLILPGDSPLINPKTLKALLNHHRKTKAACTILSAVLDEPGDLGRIVRDGKGEVLRIVERTDASTQERAIREVNSSTYVFDRAAMRSALTKVEAANKQGEFYLTDVVAVLKEKGGKIVALSAAEPHEVLGVNSRAQLASVAALLRASINTKHMDDGVTMIDPAQTYIDAGVKIGRDTIIYPPAFLSGATKVGANCEIGPGARITNSIVEDGARVIFATLDGARVGKQASVGPYAYLRPGTVLKARSKVGTFVEVKGSTIGEGSKVPHLSYIGDAEIGKDVNVGAASVTLNYDSETKTKSKTIIGDGAKIGGDTMMVAPVKIGKGAVTGASTVVTKDVPPNTVVIGAPARKLRKRKDTT